MAGIPEFIRRVVAAELRGESDAALLGRFLASRDEAAFTTVVRRHGPMVYRVCRGVLGNDADAEDAAQAVFLVLARRASRVRKLDALAGWLHGVALRTSRKLRAALARRRAGEARLPAPTQSGPADLTVREAAEVLHAELEQLPARYKEPLVLCYLQGKTHDEAAAELGWTLTAFRGRLERARKRLRDRLGRRGLTPAAASLAGVLSGAGPALPATFAVAAARAAGRGPVPPAVSNLAREVLRTMPLTPFKLAASLVLVTALAASGWLALVPAVPVPQPAAAGAEAKAGPAANPRPDPLPGQLLVSRFNRFARLKPNRSGLAPVGDELDDGEFVVAHRLSPDGKAVAFQHQTQVGEVLSLWEFDQPWPGRVLRKAFIRDFYWMPDGKHLVLCAWGGVKDGLPSDFKFQMLDVATREVADLKLPEGHWAADVSPDGKWFLTVKNVDPKDGRSGAQLHRVERDSGAARLLFDKVTIMIPPRWRISPDGTRVAGMKLADDGSLQLFAGRVDGGPLRQVTREASGLNMFYGWSPDSKRLLYQQLREPAAHRPLGAYHEVVLAAGADGRGREELHDNEAHYNARGQRTVEESLLWADWR